MHRTTLITVALVLASIGLTGGRSERASTIWRARMACRHWGSEAVVKQPPRTAPRPRAARPPDRCGGLGFLALVSQAFSPLLLAQGALLAGMMANQIFYAGATLPEFKVELIGLAAVMVFAILGPLLVFSPKLEAAKRAGLREYGTLAQRYVREFDDKWLRGGAPADDPLLGSADIQSLADLGNSFEVVKGMRLAPFTMRTVLQLAVVTLLPVGPLLLTMIPLEELLERLLKIVF